MPKDNKHRQLSSGVVGESLFTFGKITNADQTPTFPGQWWTGVLCHSSKAISQSSADYLFKVKIHDACPLESPNDSKPLKKNTKQFLFLHCQSLLNGDFMMCLFYVFLTQIHTVCIRGVAPLSPWVFVWYSGLKRYDVPSGHEGRHVFLQNISSSVFEL